MRIFRLLALLALIAGGILGAWQAVEADNAKSMRVHHPDDPYIWLEDVHGKVPLAWVRAQNARTLSILGTDAEYKSDFDTLLGLMDAPDRIPFGTLDHEHLYNFWQDGDHPKGIWRRTSIRAYEQGAPHWETLLDVDKLSADEHENWVFKNSQCSPSQARCLVSLSRGGGDAVVVREFDLAMRSFLPGGFALEDAKSYVAYVDDDTVLFGSNFGPGSLTSAGYPRIIRVWHRGEDIAKSATVKEGAVGDVLLAPLVFRSAEGNVALIARAIDFFDAEYFLQAPDGAWKQLSLPQSADLKGVIGGQLVFTLRKDWAPEGSQGKFRAGSLLALSLDDSTRARPHVAALFTPGPRSSIEDVATTANAVYASVFENVTGSIHMFRPGEHGSWSAVKLDLPANGATHIVAANDFGPEVQFRFESFLVPTTLYAFSGSGHPVAIQSLPQRFDTTGMTTWQFEAISKDGTRIPYFVVRAPRAGASPEPALLYGYGGFEVSQTPVYSASIGRMWLARGGTYVLANIRGGGEFGPSWHNAALKRNRQKSFDDFAAVAADIVARGLTTPRQLAIMGGSNGGLLVSTVMTQHPELLGAVVCQVPLIDMIRYTQIGAGASWIAEYGDPADPQMAAYIRTYSPYQNVKKEVKYPPVFFVTATSDDRVTPVHARKMAAKMMAQGHEVLFYENTDGGHAGAADHKQAAEMWALSFAYLKRELGLPPVAGGAGNRGVVAAP